MPLTFDLPIEQLRTYEGKNPRPSDFDAFWDKSLAEMRSVDPKVELIAAEFRIPNVKCFHLFFTGVGDVRVHAKLLQPANASSLHPAVLMFHGYTGDSGDWYDKLGFVSAGFTVAALDCRGQGDYQKIAEELPAILCMGISFVDWMMRFGVTLKRCSSDTYFSIQPNLPESLWKCLM